MTSQSDARARLLAATQALLAAGQVPTVDAVAAAAGVSRSTYYRLVGGSHEAFLQEAGYVAEPTARARLLEAAAALLDEVGLTGLVMDAVAERAGVSRTTLYRLFPGKQELLGALAQSRSALGLLSTLLEAQVDRPPEEVLPVLVAAAAPRLLANRGLLRAVLAEASFGSPESAAGRTVISDIFVALMRYLERQMADGRLRRTEPLAALLALVGPLMLYATVHPDFWTAMAGPLPPPAQTFRAIVDLWLRGMASEQPAA